MRVDFQADREYLVFEISNERAELASQIETATVRLVPLATKTVDWRMTFE